MSEFITGRVESAKRSLIERAKATLRKHGEPCPDAQAAEIERLARERDHWQATHAAERLASMNAEARATAAEAAKDRAWALYNHQSEARVAVTAERDAALARATAAEAEAERLRDALRSINGMVNEVATAPMTADRWLDRIEERARDALERKP